MIKKGQVTEVNGEGGVLQSLFHIEVDRLTSKEEMQALKEELLNILSDTRLVVNDWQPMVDKLKIVTDDLEKNKDRVSMKTDRLDETIAFLRWLGDHNFTFMGYKDYDLAEINGDTELRPAKEKGLGLFADEKRIRSVKLSELSDSARLEAKKTLRFDHNERQSSVSYSPSCLH